MTRHGTSYHYNIGCRCYDCREAKFAARRAARARAKAANTSGYQHELAYGRSQKERYRGQCVDCGKPTTGCFGPGKAPLRCLKCQSKITAAAKIGTGSAQAKILAFLDGQDRRYMEIANLLGSKGHAAVQLDRLRHYGLVERVARGVYRKAADRG